MNINVETALKTIVSTVVPEEEAPVGEHREEKIQAGRRNATLDCRS